MQWLECVDHLPLCEWYAAVGRYYTICETSAYRGAIATLYEACEARDASFALAIMSYRVWSVATAIGQRLVMANLSHNKPPNVAGALAPAVLALWVRDELPPTVFAALTSPFGSYLLP
jgi:hypothetical protein